MAETLEKQFTSSLQIPSEKSFVEAIAGLVSIASAYYSIVGSVEEREHAIALIKASLDKWLETIAPLEYIPGLVDELDRLVEKPLWDTIPDLTEDLFEKILVETLVFKKKVLVEDQDVVLEAIADTYRAHTIMLLEVLHGGEIDWSSYPRLSDIMWGTSDPFDVVRRLATVNALAIVLSTNRQ